MTNYIEYQINSFQQNPKTLKIRISQENAMYPIHKTAIQQLQKQRQGNAHCKTRSEVKGGGKKPWKQKGTGRARAGSIRSPLWRGGGVIFGPKTKQYYQKINKKEKNLAINNMLYNKRNYTMHLDPSFLILNRPKTKDFLHKLESLNINLDKKLLIIVGHKHINTYLATRNLKNVEIIAASQINLLSIIKSGHIIIDDDAINIINSHIL